MQRGRHSWWRILAASAAAIAGAVVVARVAFEPDAAVPRGVAVCEPRKTHRPARLAAGSPAPSAAAQTPAPAAAVRAPLPPAPGRRILFSGAPRRPGSLATIARDLIAEHRDELGLASMPGELTPSREFGSLAGWHVRWRQTLRGVPVHGSEVSAHVALDGRPLLAAADVFPVEGAETTPVVTSAASLVAATELLSEDGSGVEARAPELVILPEGRTGRLAWRIDARTGDESARVFVDAADGTPLRVDDLRRSADAAANLFEPNPVHSLRNGTLRDNNDADSASLTAARVPVTLRRLDGSGYLRGTWADVTRTRRPANSPALDWRSVTRLDDVFEQLMAYHHIDGVQQRLQDLGITNVNARQTDADAHAFRDDNSYYDGFDRSLRFGDGGVDDAEDADVIRHEYGHAMQADQVEDFGLTEEGGAIGEGFCDFQAVSFHTSGDAKFDAAFAAWDGTAFNGADPPALRRTDGTKKYPHDMQGEVHADGEIWSRFLWDLRGLLGNDESLKLVVESHFLLAPSARLRDAADAILAADESLRQAADVAAIRLLLDARGLAYSAPGHVGPDDDALEPNDDAGSAAPLAAGFHAGLVLANEDWYALTVPPSRRLHVTAAFAPGRAGLIVEVRTPGGARVARANGFDGSAEVDAAAGPDGAALFVRVFDEAAGGEPVPYSLSVVDADLAVLKPGRTKLLTLGADARAVFRVTVNGAQVLRGATLRIAARRVKPGGATADVRLTSPTGRLISAFGDARIAGGTVVRVPADEPGSWTVEVQPRNGSSGALTLKPKFE